MLNATFDERFEQSFKYDPEGFAISCVYLTSPQFLSVLQPSCLYTGLSLRGSCCAIRRPPRSAQYCRLMTSTQRDLLLQYIARIPAKSRKLKLFSNNSSRCVLARCKFSCLSNSFFLRNLVCNAILRSCCCCLCGCIALVVSSFKHKLNRDILYKYSTINLFFPFDLMPI